MSKSFNAAAGEMTRTQQIVRLAEWCGYMRCDTSVSPASVSYPIYRVVDKAVLIKHDAEHVQRTFDPFADGNDALQVLNKAKENKWWIDVDYYLDGGMEWRITADECHTSHQDFCHALCLAVLAMIESEGKK